MDAGTHGWRLDRSLLRVGSLLTLQAGGQLLVSAVCHLFDEVQTLFDLQQHTDAHAHTHTHNIFVIAVLIEKISQDSPGGGPRSALQFFPPCKEGRKAERF